MKEQKNSISEDFSPSSEDEFLDSDQLEHETFEQYCQQLCADVSWEIDPSIYDVKAVRENAAKVIFALENGNPLPLSLSKWLLSVMARVVAGEPPNQAFGIKDATKSRYFRDYRIYYRVEEEFENQDNQKEAFARVAQTEHLSEDHIERIYRRMKKSHSWPISDRA